MAANIEMYMLMTEPKVIQMVNLYQRNQGRDLVPRAVTSSILILADMLCGNLLSLEADVRRTRFTRFTHGMDLVYASYYFIRPLPGTSDDACDQTEHQADIKDYYFQLRDQVQLMFEVFDYYKRDDIPRDTKMTRLNEDKNTVRQIWKDCVYANVKTIFLMKDYGICTSTSKNAKTAIGSSLHKVLKNDATEQMENDNIEQMVNSISTLEEAYEVSKKIEDAILLWKRKSRRKPTKQHKYDKSIETAIELLFELKYRFPSWEAKIGSEVLDLNLHVGLACIEAYSRAVEQLASKVNQLIGAQG